jgi:hypothetical protein
LTHGQCYTTDRYAGGSFWLPPGTWQMGFLRQLLMLPAMIRFAGRDMPRLMSFLTATERVHPHDPHYYLPVIGVAPPSATAFAWWARSGVKDSPPAWPMRREPHA